MNGSRTLIKHLSCKCICNVDGRNCSSNQKWNNDNWCDGKNPKQHRAYEKYCIWNPATWSCENGKYVRSTIDDSLITCHKIIDASAKSRDKTTKCTSAKTVLTNFNGKKVTCKTKIIYILLTFLLITITLLIALSI